MKLNGMCRFLVSRVSRLQTNLTVPYNFRFCMVSSLVFRALQFIFGFLFFPVILLCHPFNPHFSMRPREMNGIGALFNTDSPECARAHSFGENFVFIGKHQTALESIFE